METITTAPETTTPAPTPTPAAVPVKTLGIVSLVLGVTAIATGFQFWLGVPAIIVGIIALRQEPEAKNFAIWGIITGAVSAIGVVFTIIGVSLLLPFAGLAALGGFFG